MEMATTLSHTVIWDVMHAFGPRCRERNRRQEQEARIGAKMMHDGTGDDLAERCANADRRADGAQGEIEAARTAREVRNHEDGDNPKYSRRHTIQNLNCKQRNRVVGECVEDGANRQDSKRDK